MATTDGRTWTIISLVPTVPFFNDVTCANTSDCWGSYYAGGIYGSTDGGATWVEQNGLAANDVSCVDATHCWAAGQGGIAATTDGTT